MNGKLPNWYSYVLISVVFFSASTRQAVAQKSAVSGIITDTAEKKPLQFAMIALIDLSDSTLYKVVRSNEEGAFMFTAPPPGRYTLMVSYPRMADYLVDIELKDTSRLKLGELPMVLQSALLEEVIVRSAAAIRMKGDTLEYKADSFFVKPGSNVEALLKRLPGIVVDKNGKIIAQGQEVKRLLVDGDEFFADDPKVAAKYLGAGAVDKVQVYDAKSDQSAFTGIDDGQLTKTINLKLKSDKRSGYFGKVSVGSDGGKNYNTSAMGAVFKNNLKAAVFGTASRTGKAGLSYEELSRYAPRDYEMIDDGTGNIYYTSGYESDDDYSGNGIPSIVSGGAHYSNKWKNKTQKLVTNYRIKKINAEGWSNSSNYTLLPDGTSFDNTSSEDESSHQFSQKASGSFTMPLDSMNTTVQISVNGGQGQSSSERNGWSSSRNEKNIEVNNSNTRNMQSGTNQNFESNITMRHKFRKQGRSFILTLQQQYGGKQSDNINYSQNNYFKPASGEGTYSDLLDQLQRTDNTIQSFSAKAVYSNAINEHWNFSIDYGFKSSNVRDMLGTFNKKAIEYDERIDSLSIDYGFLTTTHITAASLGWRKNKFSATLGSDFFVTSLKQTDNDIKTTSQRDFVNFAPRLMAAMRFNSNRTLSVTYTGKTRQPGVYELQPVRRSSNPLYSYIGNPDLKPEFTNRIQTRFNDYNNSKGSMLYFSGSMAFTGNAITNSTTTDANGKTVSGNINLNGNFSYSGSGQYSWEYKKLHLKPRISGSFNNSKRYSFLNSVKITNVNQSYNLNPGLSYTLREKLELSYSGSLSYSIGSSSINQMMNRNITHNHSIETTVYLPWKLELSSDADFSFRPKNKNFNSAVNIVVWNAWIKKNVLKEKGEIMFSVNDILNKTTGYRRYTSGNTIGESNESILKRYFLLTFTWNFASKL